MQIEDTQQAEPGSPAAESIWGHDESHDDAATDDETANWIDYQEARGARSAGRH